MTTMNGLLPCSFHANPDWNRGLPGIDFDHKGCVMPYFAGAPREYADNEGWQVVKRRGNNLKKYRKRRGEVQAQIAAADN